MSLFNFNRRSLYAPHVEHFGEYPSHMEYELNYQLDQMIKHFDKEYKSSGGTINSVGHHIDRIEFSRLAAESLIEFASNNPDGQITHLQTDVEIHCTSIPKVINVSTISTFDGSDPATKLFGMFSLN